MKKFVLPLFICLVNLFTYGQQWIDQQYQYDSVLNVPYGASVNFNGTMDSLHMDIYTPKCLGINQVSSWPLMVIIHGGAFIEGSKNDASVQDYCKDFARRGYVTASISYRLGFISDDNLWTCNYPNYSCIFAGDSAEWIRANYRGIQDAKGAIRYLVNRHQQLSIDTNNVFLVGESAGAFIALGAGLMNDPSERPAATYALSDLPAPNANTLSCNQNLNETFSAMVPRPDLGGIDGDIEPSTIHYTIKGIGNMFGAMLTDLLQLHPNNVPKPAIFSYHQTCDLIVPIDSKQVFWGLDWCMTNGYNCYAIANTPIAHGSQTISVWNTQNNYNYTIQNQFTAAAFPYAFAFVPGSCLDQASTPCHAYDNMPLRQSQLASFFAPLISSNEICQSLFVDEGITTYSVHPNPSNGTINFDFPAGSIEYVEVTDLSGKVVFRSPFEPKLDLTYLQDGVYLIQLTSHNKLVALIKCIKR